MGVHGHYIAGVEVEPKLSNMFLERNMVTPYFCLLHRQGNRKATPGLEDLYAAVTSPEHNGYDGASPRVLRVKSPLHNRFATYPQCFARDSNPHLRLRSTTLRCQTQLSEVLLSQVKSRLFSVPNPVRDNPCYSLLLAVHPFLLANLWHLPPFGECSRESSKA